jgi:hypothetical protein
MTKLIKYAVARADSFEGFAKFRCGKIMDLLDFISSLFKIEIYPITESAPSNDSLSTGWIPKHNYKT